MPVPSPPVGPLAGRVAHDFNNQLSGVLGYAELLARRLDDPRLRGYAESIARAAGRAADLTRDLLAFARLGRYLSEPIDLHDLVGEVVTLLSRSLDKRLEIRQDLRAPRPVVVGDPSQLQSALLNLALKARDAMPEGAVLGFSTTPWPSRPSRGRPRSPRGST